VGGRGRGQPRQRGVAGPPVGLRARPRARRAHPPPDPPGRALGGVAPVRTAPG
jgi:hypothetical protein